MYRGIELHREIKIKRAEWVYYFVALVMGVGRRWVVGVAGLISMTGMVVSVMGVGVVVRLREKRMVRVAESFSKRGLPVRVRSWSHWVGTGEFVVLLPPQPMREAPMPVEVLVVLKKASARRPGFSSERVKVRVSLAMA